MTRTSRDKLPQGAGDRSGDAITTPLLRVTIEGVEVRELTIHDDARGQFTEFHRDEWTEGAKPVQFNLVRSHARTLRGIHVHVRHADWLLVIEGAMQLCLGDLRDRSATRGVWEVVTLDARRPTTTFIPPGVAHGFYFPVASTHVYGVSEYWRPEEELGCHWADRSLRLPWSVPHDCIVSSRDAKLGSLADLVERLAPWQHQFA